MLGLLGAPVREVARLVVLQQEVQPLLAEEAFRFPVLQV